MSADQRSAFLHAVVVQAEFDAKSANKQMQNATSDSVMYPITDRGQLSVLPREIVFKWVNSDSASDAVSAMTSLNGAGVNEVAAFPGDEQAQAAALQRRIMPLGTVWLEQIYANSTSPRPTEFGTQMFGQQTTVAPCMIGVGQLLRYHIPLPSEVANGENARRDNVDPNKVTLEVRPVVPDLIAERLVGEVRRTIADTKRWAEANRGNTLAAFPFLNFTRRFNDMNLLAVILSLKHIGRFVVADAIKRVDDIVAGGDTQANAVNRVLNVELDQYIALLAKKLKVVDANAIFEKPIDSGVLPTLTNLNDNAQIQEGARRFLYSLVASGQDAELAFGYDPNTRKIVGVNETTNSISHTSVEGQLFEAQLIRHKQFFSALVDIFREEVKMSAGVATKNADRDEPIAWTI